MQRQSAMSRAVKIGIVLPITLVTAAVFPDIPRRAVAHALTPLALKLPHAFSLPSRAKK